MKPAIFRFRVWLANQLVRMAVRVRPKRVTDLMQMLEDQMIFGTGFMRIKPEDIMGEYNFNPPKEKND